VPDVATSGTTSELTESAPFLLYSEDIFLKDLFWKNKL
jgi:hypothetical protein